MIARPMNALLTDSSTPTLNNDGISKEAASATRAYRIQNPLFRRYRSRSVLLLLLALLMAIPLIFASGAQAQVLRQMQVERIASNRVAVFQEYTQYAAVIVESSIQGLRIDSNLEIIADLSEPANGIYRVIIHPRSQALYFRAPGYMEARISTGPLQARQVLDFTAEPQDRSITDTGDLLIRSEPSGASFTVEGLPGRYTTPHSFTDIIAQTYNIRVELQDHETKEISVRVDPLRPSVRDVVLTPTFGFLTIGTPDAQLFLNTEEVAQEYRVGYTVNQPLRLDVGSYTFRLSREHYQDFTGRFRIDPGATVFVSPTLDPDFATLRVNANVPNFQLRAPDNNAPATNTRNEINLERGVRTVVVSAQGYADLSLRVTARPGARIDTTVVLESLAAVQDRQRREQMPRGILNVTADVPDAEIFINGERRGQGEVSLSMVPDTYQIEVRHPHLGRQQTRVFVPSAGVVEETLLLRPSRGQAVFLSALLPGTGHLYTNRNRGYFYLAGAAAAAGFTVWARLDYNAANDRYDTALLNYQQANTLEDAARYRTEVLDAFGAQNTAYDNMMLGLAVFGGVYAVQMLDILILRPRYGYRGSRQTVQAGFGPQGANLTLRF